MSDNKLEFSNASLQSPVRATYTTSPKDGSGCNAFVFYSNGTKKSSGLTPNGKTKVELKPHEGLHHKTFKSPGNSLYQDEKDFYTATTFDAKYKYLLLALSNLKTRIDTYYQRKQKNRDQGHYTYTYRLINMCIHMLQEMVNLPEDVKAYPFLDRLNGAIQNAQFDENLYNPIDMLPCYTNASHQTYDKRRVDKQSELCTPLTKASINAAQVDSTALSYMGVPKKGVPVHATPIFPFLICDSDLHSDLADRLRNTDDFNDPVSTMPFSTQVSSSITPDTTDGETTSITSSASTLPHNTTHGKKRYGLFEAVDTSHNEGKAPLFGVSFLFSPKNRAPTSANRKKLKLDLFDDNSESDTASNRLVQQSTPS